MRILATTLIVRRPPTHRDKPPSGGVGRRPVILNRSGSQLEGWKIGRCDPSGPAAASLVGDGLVGDGLVAAPALATLGEPQRQAAAVSVQKRLVVLV
jgi:hypothetical protein